MDKRILDKLDRIRKDPWEFAKIVWTQDQADSLIPIKLFPSHHEYLKLYCKLWQTQKQIAVPKSRRMFMTWMNLILYTWDTAFHIGRHNAIVSKKEDDSANLIEKCKFLLDNIREEDLPRELIPKYVTKFNCIDFPETNSRIQGFPSGEGQLRQYTLSGMMLDELAFWADAEETVSASIPTTEGGGRITAISSPSPGYFKRLVFDGLDAKSDEEIDIHSGKRLFPMDGVEIWKNRSNKFCVFQLHFTANPEKRSDEFKDRSKIGMPKKQWDMEYDLSWETYEGTPVYPDFSTQDHVSKIELHPQPGLPLLIGMDFGLTPAAIISQLQGETMVVLHELCETNMGADRFSNKLIKLINLKYPNWSDRKRNIRLFIDPAGSQRVQTDENTCMRVLASKGFEPIPGAITWEERRQSVEKFIIGRNKAGPLLKINAASCPLFIKACQGGYRYPDNALSLEPNKIRPVKDIHSHVSDAFQMTCSRVMMAKTNTPVKIPSMSYSFSKGS